MTLQFVKKNYYYLKLCLQKIKLSKIKKNKKKEPTDLSNQTVNCLLLKFSIDQ